MMARARIGLVHVLGLSLLATGAQAVALPPVDATDAAEACKASWSAQPPITEPADMTNGPPRATFVRPSPSVLCMRGAFWFDTTRRIQEIADPAAVRTLVITSDGGVTEPAIDLAKLAERHHWRIVVAESCLSSCANYVFLSRTEKVVLPQSMLGWHGLPPEPGALSVGAFRQWQASMPPWWPSFDYETAVAYARHSTEFLAERDVPPDLCRSQPEIGPSKDDAAQLNSLEHASAAFWSYGREVLEQKYHVTGIVSMWEPGTPEQGTELARKNHHINLFYFDLSGH